MAYDAFLKIDDVKGEVQDSQYKEWIEISSFSWGVSNAGSSASGGGGGAGKASFQDIHFTKSLDKSSATLMLHCANGAHFQKCHIEMRKSGGDPSGKSSVFLKIDLADVLVSSVLTAGAEQGDDRPVEEVGLNFAKFHLEYDAPDGEVDAFDWNVATNTTP